MMLYLTDYYIAELFEDKLLIWSTIKSKGVILENNLINLFKNIESEKKINYTNEKWLRELNEIGILLPINQKENEAKIVDLLHNSTVFTDSHMSITIIPTDACNLRCIYCYQSDQTHFMDELVEDSIIKMISKNKTLKSIHISWFGGEPLCNKDLVIRMMKKINIVCKERGIVLISDITTNATLLDLDTFKTLLQLKVVNYQITIDGPMETHDIQRPTSNGKSSFNMIMKNLIDIRDNVSSNVFNIGIRTNFTEYVHEHMHRFVEDLQREFLNDKRFYFFFQWVKNWGGVRIDNMTFECLSDSESINKYGVWMDETARVGVKTGHISQVKAGSGLCVAARKNSFIINYDGTIHKCTTALYDQEYSDINNIGFINKNGDLFIDSIKHVQWINRNTDFENCYSCNLYPICQGMPCPIYRIKNGVKACNKNDQYIRIMVRAFAKQGNIPVVSEN